MEEQTFEGWAIVEFMGHRKLGGYLKEETIAGQKFLRLDVVTNDGNTAVTQFYSASAVYCITPTSETVTRAYGTSHQPVPVQRYELPALKAVSLDEDITEMDEEYDYQDDEL